MAESKRRLPTLEEFFVAHGVLSRQPRKVFPFHRRIFRAITQWVCGTLADGKRNLAICMPPRHGKTFIAHDLVSWGLMCFPDSEWIYTSYSASLAIAQTVVIKETCASDWYRKAAPYVGVESGKGRQDFFKTIQGGAVYGVGTEGSLTGFGAGKTRKEFGGGIVIDDPLAAIDALTVRREKCNQLYSQALYSRRNSTNTPVMLIMQRLHEKDLVGYVLEREPELWEVLQIPVRDSEGTVLWPDKFSIGEAERLERLDPFAFSSQYMQEPTPAGGALFKREMVGKYENEPELTRIGLFADTAMKEGERNDFSVLHLMGTDGKNVYSLDMLRGKWTAPELLRQTKTFWEKHRPRRGLHNAARFIGFFVEDKASGTGLIQTLRAESNIPVLAVKRNRDKVSRAHDVLPWVAAGRFLVPAKAAWAETILAEMCAFSPAMTHSHDDIVDTVIDGLDTLLGGGRELSRGMDLS